MISRSVENSLKKSIAESLYQLQTLIPLLFCILLLPSKISAGPSKFRRTFALAHPCAHGECDETCDLLCVRSPHWRFTGHTLPAAAEATRWTSGRPESPLLPCGGQ